MKMSKRMTAMLLSILAILMFLPVQALAAGRIDLDCDMSLTISYSDDKTPLAGAKFDVFLVATVDEYGELTPTETFSQFNVDIRGPNDEAWRVLASTLEGYVLRDRISPTDSGRTDRHGLLTFPTGENTLLAGLYLVLGHTHIQGGYIYEATPFMVMLPSLDNEANCWIYDVTVNPKYDVDPIPEEPETANIKVLKVWDDDGHENERPENIVVQLLQDGNIYDTVVLNAGNNWRYTWTGLDSSHKWTVVEESLEGYTVTVTQEGVTFVVTNTYAKNASSDPTPSDPTNPDNPSDPKLPQTGQLWWPIPIMAAAGMILVIIGLIRRRGIRNEE